MRFKALVGGAVCLLGMWTVMGGWTSGINSVSAEEASAVSGGAGCYNWSVANCIRPGAPAGECNNRVCYRWYAEDDYGKVRTRRRWCGLENTACGAVSIPGDDCGGPYSIVVEDPTNEGGDDSE